jgi:hypothetical protein
MKNSLKHQYSFAVSVLLCGVIATISYFAVTHEKSSLLEERQLRAKSLEDDITMGVAKILK